MKKKLLPLILMGAAAVAMVACGDDESSSPAAGHDTPASPAVLPDTVQTLDSLINEYKCRESYKCAHVYLVEMEHVMECDGEAWVYLSDYLPSSCGYEMEESGADVSEESGTPEDSDKQDDVEKPSEETPEEACYEGGANITISNIENLNMACGSSSEGMTIYDEDSFVLHTCKGGQWEKEEMFPCIQAIASVIN